MLLVDCCDVGGLLRGGEEGLELDDCGVFLLGGRLQLLELLGLGRGLLG